LGLTDSLALVEGELQKAHSKEHLFEALLEKLRISDPANRENVQTALIRALKKKDENGFKEFIFKLAGVGAEKAVQILLMKIFPKP
jgi:hypothetical protein